MKERQDKASVTEASAAAIGGNHNQRRTARSCSNHCSIHVFQQRAEISKSEYRIAQPWRNRSNYWSLPIEARATPIADNMNMKSSRASRQNTTTICYLLASLVVYLSISEQTYGFVDAFQPAPPCNRLVFPATSLFSEQNDSPFFADQTDSDAAKQSTNKDDDSSSAEFGQSVPYVPLSQRQSAPAISLDELEIIQRNRTRNIIVAIASFAVSIIHYIWQLAHPVTAVEILATMQSQSAPLTSIGNNGKPTVIDFW